MRKYKPKKNLTPDMFRDVDVGEKNHNLDSKETIKQTGYEALKKFFNGKTIQIDFGNDNFDYVPNDMELVKVTHNLTHDIDGPAIVVLKETKQ